MYDIKNLHRLKHLTSTAPAPMQAFWDFDKAAVAPGAIPRKYKELMAVAVALTTQCPFASICTARQRAMLARRTKR